MHQTDPSRSRSRSQSSLCLCCDFSVLFLLTKRSVEFCSSKRSGVLLPGSRCRINRPEQRISRSCTYRAVGSVRLRPGLNPSIIHSHREHTTTFDVRARGTNAHHIQCRVRRTRREGRAASTIVRSPQGAMAIAPRQELHYYG